MAQFESSTTTDATRRGYLSFSVALKTVELLYWTRTFLWSKSASSFQEVFPFSSQMRGFWIRIHTREMLKIKSKIVKGA